MTWCHSPDDLEWLAEELGFAYEMPRLDGRPYEDRNPRSCGKRPAIERLHRWVWRPASRLLRLNVKIFVSVQDLRLVGRTTTPASTP